MSTTLRKRRALVGALLLVGGVLIGILLSLLFARFTIESQGNGNGNGAIGTPGTTITISGNLTEAVTPGASIPIDLVIANSYDAPIVLTDLRVFVESVSAPNSTTQLPCSTKDFTSSPSAVLEARVLAGESRSLTQLNIPSSHWPAVGMPNADTNQDGCKGATLTLRYEGSARVVE